MTTSAPKPAPGRCEADQAARDDMLAILRSDGVVTSSNPSLTPLTGGVSSEIYLVADGSRRFVVKRALAKLKVRDAWFADTRRNVHEQAFLRYVGSFLPDAVPAILCPDAGGAQAAGGSERTYFAMEYLGDGFVNWKNELLAGRAEVEHARRAMQTLATIHARSAGDANIARAFDTTRDFMQLRIDPYLLTTGAAHPELRERFEAQAARLAACREALVHGDFSPKNILINEHGRLVLLDCEVAWYGDPAFDVAFLLNHLLLKALYHAPQSVGLPGLVDAAWVSYRTARVDAAHCDEVQARLLELLPMLMLARVDGKSPVEYLDAAKQGIVREFVYREMQTPSPDFTSLIARWFERVALIRTGESGGAGIPGGAIQER